MALPRSSLDILKLGSESAAEVDAVPGFPDEPPGGLVGEPFAPVEEKNVGFSCAMLAPGRPRPRRDEDAGVEGMAYQAGDSTLAGFYTIKVALPAKAGYRPKGEGGDVRDFRDPCYQIRREHAAGCGRASSSRMGRGAPYQGAPGEERKPSNKTYVKRPNTERVAGLAPRPSFGDSLSDFPPSPDSKCVRSCTDPHTHRIDIEKSKRAGDRYTLLRNVGLVRKIAPAASPSRNSAGTLTPKHA
ncbi:hypothetical protein BDK51DRAFT_43077 [Blyttiomyces helicus]|uniref:Uncharacterized protein n=1 Tax=Blyttiomyces helicus TaxID=388810 RepID=A0A4P9W5L2_9FUNG|nr:hypothetical protein BDK51DRAFT_43077 [Blyttiomyces helicus]|eukprot:RKO87701.1 hypothetical protein BDK51DRAFT_43077 [Blyttiomyces helicus]